MRLHSYVDRVLLAGSVYLNVDEAPAYMEDLGMTSGNGDTMERSTIWYMSVLRQKT